MQSATDVDLGIRTRPAVKIQIGQRRVSPPPAQRVVVDSAGWQQGKALHRRGNPQHSIECCQRRASRVDATYGESAGELNGVVAAQPVHGTQLSGSVQHVGGQGDDGKARWFIRRSKEVGFELLDEYLRLGRSDLPQSLLSPQGGWHLNPTDLSDHEPGQAADLLRTCLVGVKLDQCRSVPEGDQ